MDKRIPHSKKTKTGLRIFMRSPTAIAGFMIVVAVFLMAVFAPVIAPYGPTDTDLYARMKPPSVKHFFGTDNLGRDVFSRIIWGSRVSLQVGLVSVIIGMTIGVLLGLVAGYYGKTVDFILFAFVDILISFPAILLAMAIVATLGPGLVQVMIAVGAAMVPRFARVVRSSVLTVREQNYILAIKAVGASDLFIILRYILPNILTPIIVLATLNCAFALIMEAALSFLGIGVQPPDPTWGSILSDGRISIRTATWISTFSGLAITITVLGFNLLGDALRDILDPKMKRIVQSR